MTEPTDQLATYYAIKHVQAGRITEVTDAGCYVQNKDGRTATFRPYLPSMTPRYRPDWPVVVGDFWVIHLPENLQTIEPEGSFMREGYIRIDDAEKDK